MKQTFLVATLAVFLLPRFYLSIQAENSGFDSATIKIITANDAMFLKVGDSAILEGKITKPEGVGHYTFQDSSGEITVAIDNQTLGNIHIPSDKFVRISGKAGKEYFENTINVENIEVLKDQPPVKPQSDTVSPDW